MVDESYQLIGSPSYFCCFASGIKRRGGLFLGISWAPFTYKNALLVASQVVASGWTISRNARSALVMLAVWACWLFVRWSELDSRVTFRCMRLRLFWINPGSWVWEIIKCTAWRIGFVLAARTHSHEFFANRRMAQRQFSNCPTNGESSRRYWDPVL